VKLIRLIANICTEDKVIHELLKDYKDLFSLFMESMLTAIKRKNVDRSEEFIFNAISCTTNLLFYDTPVIQLFSEDLRGRIFQTLKLFILQTSNEEI
jgi:hypothetical protein